MKIMRGNRDCVHVENLYTSGANRYRALLILQNPFDDYEWKTGEPVPLPLIQSRRYDDVRNPGLVFETQKEKSAGCARASDER